ncbi:MAG TPA: OmpA family protein [Vicinamibacterales bacterium]|nr:OmpA family protein [Vicinamibacterales bacterium]
MGEAVAEREDGRTAHRGARSGPDPPEGDADSFEELRSLIIGDNPVKARDVSRVLPEAIVLRAGDPNLTKALTSSVEEAITSSVRRNPRPLADALFPVIGPAIRKAIVQALASMTETLSRTIEHSVSWRALRWRWTAWRTGRPFAEIVLLQALEYRVEQVYLIHRETGLLLHHVPHDPQAGPDADQVSAMLTAIRDFVSDSFHAGAGDSLDALRVGELSVIVEQGPHAVLAAVVRGGTPLSVRAVIQDALESIHLHMAGEFESFRGDAAPFDRTRPILEDCLVTQFRPSRLRPSYRGWIFAGTMILVAAGIWAFFVVRERQRWNAYLESLRAEPGLVVLASGRRDGRYFVAGLRDRLARDPVSIAAASGLPPGSVDGRWEPYEGLHPAFVASRARDLLRPPPGVTLEYRDEVLTASGPAPERWIVESERLAPAISGVRRLEFAGIPAAERLRAQIESTAVLFPTGRSRIAPGHEDVVRQLEELLRELNETVRLRQRRARIEIVGHTDADGSDAANLALSQARADVVLTMLQSPLFDALDLTARGVGSSEPLTSGAFEADKARNRRVALRVSLAGEPPSAAGRQ